MTFPKACRCIEWPGAAWLCSGIRPSSEQCTWREQTTQVMVPGSKGPNHMVRNVVIRTVTIFKPAVGTENGTSLIVAPGGAFRFLMIEPEGYDLARRLTKQGITTFVLEYRVAHIPEDDAEMLGFGVTNRFSISHVR